MACKKEKNAVAKCKSASRLSELQAKLEVCQAGVVEHSAELNERAPHHCMSCALKYSFFARHLQLSSQNCRENSTLYGSGVTVFSMLQKFSGDRHLPRQKD